MTKVDHIEKARGYLARGEEFYARAADEIIAAMEEDPTLTQRRVGALIGRSQGWVQTLLAWRRRESSSIQPTPYAGQAESQDKAKTKKLLRDPETRRSVLAEMNEREVNDVREAALEVGLEQAAAKRAEREDPEKVTAGKAGAKAFREQLQNQWADGNIARLHWQALSLAEKIKREGLVLGSVTDEEALKDVLEVERIAAEVRVTLQTRVRDAKLGAVKA